MLLHVTSGGKGAGDTVVCFEVSKMMPQLTPLPIVHLEPGAERLLQASCQNYLGVGNSSSILAFHSLAHLQHHPRAAEQFRLQQQSCSDCNNSPAFCKPFPHLDTSTPTHTNVSTHQHRERHRQPSTPTRHTRRVNLQPPT